MTSTKLAMGAKAIVRVMAGNQRTTPEIAGKVIRVSPDLAHEQPNGSQPAQAYYTVRISLPPDEVARLKDLRLVPGYAGRSLHPDIRAHPARVPAQAASRSDSADVSRAMMAGGTFAGAPLTRPPAAALVYFPAQN